MTSLGLRNLYAFDSDPSQIKSLLKECPSIEACQSFESGLTLKPDAVFILTPPKTHVPLAVQAIRAGCHVFCEKPLSDTLDGIDELGQLVRELKRKFMVGLCFRYHQGALKVNELLKAGAIGRLVSIRALMGEHLPEVRPDYKSLFTAEYSGALDLTHDLDLAISYANQPIRSVQALLGTYSDIGIRAPDVVEILIDFKDRCMASIHLDFFQRPRRRHMELVGTEGTIILEFSRWDQYTLSVYQTSRADWSHFTGQTIRDDMFRDEDREFLVAVAEDRSVSCSIEEACKSLLVVDAAQKAAGRGQIGSTGNSLASS